jgi:hypothetical protein
VGKLSNPLHPLPIAEAPWEAISSDLIRPLPESRTYNVIITIVDTWTKAIKLEPVNITISAMGAAIVMRDQVYREEGLPVKVYSDWGPQFVSKFMKEFYMLVGMEGNLSMAYHPQMDGQMERMNWEVEKYLQMFTNHQQDDWVDWLPLMEFTYNNSVNEATGNTLFFLNWGWHAWVLPTDALANPGMSTETYLEAIQMAAKKAKACLIKKKGSNEEELGL